MRVLDERAHVAEGASGRNGGFALGGGAARYDVARDSYGPERALLLWRRTEDALDRLGELAGDALRREGSLRLAADEEERDDIRKEYDALREDGLDAEWRDRDELPEHLRGSFHGAIFHSARRRGSACAARPPARGRGRGGGRRVPAGQAPRATRRPRGARVVLATDGYGRGLVPELDERIWPARGQVVATEPLDERLFPSRTTRARASITGSSSRTGGWSPAGSETSRSCPS